MAIWQQCKRVLSIFLLRMCRNGYFGASGQKSDPDIRSGDLYFLKDRCISTTEWGLRDIFDVFVQGHKPWPLAFWPRECFMYSTSYVRLTDQFLLSYDYRLDYWVTITENLITFPLSETVTAHAPCHVTYNRGEGGKIILHFEIPDPNLPIHFVTFTALRRRLSHVIGKK